MRTSIHSTVASRLSSRFRSLARNFAEQRSGASAVSLDPLGDEAMLAHSDFSRQLLQYGRQLRSDVDLQMTNAVSAHDEVFYVMAGLRQCLENSRKISFELKAKFREELDQIESVVTPALNSDEGRTCYRLLAKALRNDTAFVLNPQDMSDSAAMRLCAFGKKSKIIFAKITAGLAHTSFERIPQLCNLCPLIASDGSGFCEDHSPSKIGKRGYRRGQLVFDSLYPNRPSRGRNPFPIAVHQQWRKSLLGNLESDPKMKTVWLQQLSKELESAFGPSWKLDVAALVPRFLEHVKKKRAVNALTKLIDPKDDYASRHPRYFAGKLKEFYVFVQADRKIQRRYVITYEKLVEIVAENDASTLKAAAEVGLSRRRVQAILRAGRKRNTII